MYKILIADDHPLFREALTNIIKVSFRDSVIHEASDYDGAYKLLNQSADFDLVLLDLNMPGMLSLSGLINIKSEFPQTPVAIISAEDNKSIILQAISFGAVGYLTKSSSRKSLSDAIRSILSGDAYLPPDIIRGTTKEKNDEHASITPELISTLTKRQLLILERMAQGDSNKQIAYHFQIAETTVKAHVSTILRKLNVHNRIKAALSANSIDFRIYLDKLQA